MKKGFIIAFAAAGLLLGPIAMVADAKPKFAKNEGKACAYCHLNPAGGGARGFRGLFYGVNKLSFTGFKEDVEAKKAGVKPNSMGKDTKPTKTYPPKAPKK